MLFRSSAVAGLHGDRLKLRIAAAPLEGRANAALLAFVAERLGIPRTRVSLARGAHSRDKLVAVAVPECEPAKLLASDG